MTTTTMLLTTALAVAAAMAALMTVPAARAFDGDESAGKQGVTIDRFGQTADGTPVDIFTLTNKNGMTAKVMTYGAILTELHVPDRHGKMGDVVLGFDNLDAYLKGHPYFGAIVGRVAKGAATR